MARRRNPWNATKPAEWDKMSKSLRRRWNRTHWRPDQWKCDLALKKEATRLRHRQEGRGMGLMDLVDRAVKSNPGKCVRILLPKGMSPADHKRMKSWAAWYKKHGQKKPKKSNPRRRSPTSRHIPRRRYA